MPRQLAFDLPVRPALGRGDFLVAAPNALALTTVERGGWPQGKLVLASDVDGHQELIRDGANGRLFSANSSEALAEAVCDMLEHRDGWQALRQEARRYVEQERNWPNSVNHYREVYGRLIGIAL